MTNPESVDITNTCLVSMTGRDEISIINPPREPISVERALVLAAWIITLAQIAGATLEDFTKILAKVQST